MEMERSKGARRHVALLCVGLLAGCATWTEESTRPSATQQLVARDLVGAMTRIGAIATDSGVLRMRRDAVRGAGVERALEDALRAAGYAIQLVDGDDAPVSRLVDIDREPGEDGKGDTYVLSIDGIGLRRDYGVSDAGRFGPVGPLYVRGVEAPESTAGAAASDPIGTALPSAPNPAVERPVADPDATDGLGSGAASRSASAGSASGVPAAASSADAGRPAAASPFGPTDENTRPGARLAPLVDAATRPRSAGAGEGPRPFTSNYRDLGGSNYRGLFASFEDREQRIIVFGNDSMRLGEAGKREIRAMVRAFDETRDVFSVLGCSLGPTGIPNGNEVLATGRANRVTEELVYAGVPQDRILDEGCWAGEQVEDLPSRGVVVTLKRESD